MAEGDVGDAVAELAANATNATLRFWELNSSQIMGKFQIAADELEPGLAFAYFMLVMMALVPIYVGSAMSVQHMPSKDKERSEESEVMTHEDAQMFPVYASGALFGLYVLFKVFGKEYVNLLVGGYFFLIGIAGATRALRPIGVLVCPAWLSERPFHVLLTQQGKPPAEKEAGDDSADAAKGKEKPTEGEEKKSAEDGHDGDRESIFDLTFDHVDLVCLAVASAVGVTYIFTKHWLTCNFFGLTLAINAVELLNLGSFKIAATLLVGLFFYDIFWVFGTDVMVTVAKSFDAPIKVLFPKDFFDNGIRSTEHAMLGLGDIVLPGVLVALLWRFDAAHGRASTRPYFWSTFVAYFLGLVLTIVIMHTFKAAQPALLYLVPAVLTTPVLVSLVRGEFAELWAYSEEDEKEEEGAEGDAKDEGKKDK